MTQASKNCRKPYLFPQKKFISVFYAINIFNTIYFFKPTNFICAKRQCLFANSTLLPRIETKNKIRCIDAPKFAFTQKSTRIWKVYLNYSKSEKSRFFYISITRQLSLVQPNTTLSPPLRRQPSCSSAVSHQCLWDIAAAWLAVIFF